VKYLVKNFGLNVSFSMSGILTTNRGSTAFDGMKSEYHLGLRDKT